MLAVEIMDTERINSVTKGMAYVRSSTATLISPRYRQYLPWGGDIEAELLPAIWSPFM